MPANGLLVHAALNAALTAALAAPALAAAQGVRADWTRVEQAGPAAAQRFIDLGTVKQSGPMAIMRQVHELDNRSGPSDRPAASSVQVSEYDCMRTKYRVLKTTAYALPWGQGKVVTSPTPNPTVNPTLNPTVNPILNPTTNSPANPPSISPAPEDWKPVEPGTWAEAVLEAVCPGY